MKKILFFLTLSLALVLVAFGQDSTYIVPEATGGFVSTIIAWLVAKWAIIGTVGTCVATLDTILAEIPSIKANSTFQIFSGWVKYLFQK